MVLRRIGPLSAAKISGVMNIVFGLIVGFFFTVASVLMSSSPDAPPAGMLFGVGAVVVLPVLYGVLGFVSGLVGALLYNVFAGVVGGLELELE
jgi:hypothetical protein